MEIKITKKVLLKEINNEMVHNYYYLIHGKIINDTKTRQRRFKFVFFFDIFDMQEWFEKDAITQKDIKAYVDEMAFSYTNKINSYDDCKEFFIFCNETIEDYNKMNKGWR